MANEIDRDPSLLLRWRGCSEVRAEVEDVPEPVAAEAPAVSEPAGDPWLAGPLPALAPARPFPAGAVMKRLGPSGLRLRGNDLAEVLQRAYASFANSHPH
jgi:hypothetical protein